MIAIIVLVCGFLFYAGVMLRRIIRYAGALKAAEATTQAFQRSVDNSAHHILVLGDSTMYGAAVKDPGSTMGGQLAQRYPGSSVETLAVNGARLRDLADQLKSAQHQHYDLVIVGVGGNDIVRLSRYSRLERDLKSLLAILIPMSDTIVLFHCVNLGNIGFFLFPLDYLFDYRTKRLSRLFSRVAQHYANVKYVNAYRPRQADFYTSATRHQFVAEDGFHANDYANRYFFDLIMKEL